MLAVADQSFLPPDDSSVAFVRMPPHIPRDSNRWALAESFLKAFSPEYDGSTLKPKFFSIPQNYGFYDSVNPKGDFLLVGDYLVSDFGDEDEDNPTWKPPSVTEEYRYNRFYNQAELLDYAPKLDSPKIRFYKKEGGGGFILTGSLEKDVDFGKLELVSTPAEYNPKVPKIKVSVEEYNGSRVKLCYAFLAADMSVCGDPVFDPVYELPGIYELESSIYDEGFFTRSLVSPVRSVLESGTFGLLGEDGYILLEQ